MLVFHDQTRAEFLRFYQEGSWAIVVDDHNYSSEVSEIGGLDMSPRQVWDAIQAKYRNEEVLVISAEYHHPENTETTWHIFGAWNENRLVSTVFYTLSLIAQEQGNQTSKAPKKKPAVKRVAQ